MTEESTTRDLVELGRHLVDAANRRDFDAVMSFWVRDPVWESGVGVFEGRAAVRRAYEDFIGAYEELDSEAVENCDLGNGVTFAVLLGRGRLPGSSGHVQMRWAAVTIWGDGVIKWMRTSTDIDAARAAAQRLAQERAQADV
jgi:ketosteroid isomerase-like protein